MNSMPLLTLNKNQKNQKGNFFNPLHYLTLKRIGVYFEGTQSSKFLKIRFTAKSTIKVIFSSLYGENLICIIAL